MRILIDIGHPAHVHLFKNLIKNLEHKGHFVLVTVKDIPSAKRLLSLYSIPFIELGKKSDNIRGKLIKQFKYDWLLYRVVKKNKIGICIGTSITIAHVSKISKMRSILLDDDDDEVQPLMTKFGHPFADYVLSPDVLQGKRRKKQTLYYPGYHELAYLHPNYFNPDLEVLKDSGLEEGEKYFILRFNAFKAHHDVGIRGLLLEQKLELIKMLEKKGKIFITTEREIEPELKRYRLTISPEKIHSLLYYAAMLIGDSQTMTSEAAILGTPAIKCNSFAGKLSVPNEIEKKYELCFSFLPEQGDKMIDKIKELLAMPNLKEEWLNRRDRMLEDKIDVTAFMVWFIENYPESVQIMKKNPDYQLRFK